MKRRVFKDDILQKHFEQNAYCIVPLLSANEISKLESIYHNNRVAEQPVVEITIKSPDIELNKKIRDQTSSVMLPCVGRYLDNYRMLHSGFIAKVPGKPSDIKLHQDSTFVDETQFAALNIWCPLTDTNDKNGALWIIKHSDRILPGLRGQPFKEYDLNDIGDDVIARFGAMIPLKAGEAIIYDTRLFHYSKQNTTDKIRVVCNLVAIPAEAQALYYHFNTDTKELQQYEINEDFLLSYFPKLKQKGSIDAKYLKTIPAKTSRKVSLTEFTEQYYQYNLIQKLTMREKLVRFFIKG